MDIISSLATLSFERESEFFSNELLILLRLIDQKILIKILFGSGGAFGNFQFMPSTIKIMQLLQQ